MLLANGPTTKSKRPRPITCNPKKISKFVLKHRSFGEGVPVSSPTNSNSKNQSSSDKQNSSSTTIQKQNVYSRFPSLSVTSGSFFCRFLDSWFIRLHLQVTGAVQCAPSARGVAEQTTLYLPVGWLDGAGFLKMTSWLWFMLMSDLSQQSGYPKRGRESPYLNLFFAEK